jgi:putative ABC transport system substrate-binding protein
MDAARRWFATRFPLAMLASVRMADAQQTAKTARVGFLSATSVPDLVEALRQGLNQRGWTEGQNLAFEQRSADGNFENIAALAGELARRNLDVMVVSGTAMPYLRHVAGNMPVVFVIADDPVTAGYVASLGRPGRRMTGLTSLNIELDGKRLEILNTALPGVGRVAVLATSHDRARNERVAATQKAARSMRLQLTILEVRGAEGLAGALDGASRARAGR